LEYAAQLAENAGEVERAESLYLQRSQIAPFSVDFVLRVVVSLMRRDRLPQALALMQTYESQVPADAAVFWRLLSQMAWELRAYETAQGAYQRFSQTSLATAADWSRLIFLVRQKHPDQAAGLALDAYRRFGALDQFVSAMGIYAEIGDMPAQSRALALLKSEDVEKAQQQVPFLLIRARFHQNQKAFDLAWLDLRSALQKFWHRSGF
jgi:polysaccharide biosynthesis protein PelB